MNNPAQPNAMDIVHHGKAIYVNHAFKSGERVFMEHNGEILNGCLLQGESGALDKANKMYFIPNKSQNMAYYEPDFAHAILVENQVMCATYTGLSSYLVKQQEEKELLNSIRTGEELEALNDGTHVWLLEPNHARHGIILHMTSNLPIYRESMNNRYFVHIKGHSGNTPILDWANPVLINDQKFALSEYAARTYLASEAQRINSDNSANTENPLYLPIEAITFAIRNYIKAKFNCDAPIKLAFVMCHDWSWHVIIRSENDENLLADQLTKDIYGINRMTMNRFVLTHRILHQHVCEKIINEQLGLAIKNSHAIPGGIVY